MTIVVRSKFSPRERRARQPAKHRDPTGVRRHIGDWPLKKLPGQQLERKIGSAVTINRSHSGKETVYLFITWQRRRIAPLVPAQPYPQLLPSTAPDGVPKDTHCCHFEREGAKDSVTD